MRTTITIALLLLSWPALAADAFDAGSFATTIEQKLQKARYMEQDCQPVSVPGWDGYETQKCTYRVTDHAGGISKAATVVMLNPSALKLSEWIINACDTAYCPATIYRRALDASLTAFYPSLAGNIRSQVLFTKTSFPRMAHTRPMASATASRRY